VKRVGRAASPFAAARVSSSSSPSSKIDVEKSGSGFQLSGAR
jgi:hypothetical protein